MTTFTAERFEKLKTYIREWKESEEKPCNDIVFVAEFTEWIKTLDKDNWSFEGENGYCGSTAIVNEYPFSVPARGELFEFAYSKDFVKVFTGYNNGYWSPEYIKLEGAEAKSLLKVLKCKFLEWGDFDE